MKDKRFAVVDIETTGGKPARDRITEVGIVIHDGKQILHSYETLINPECYIPAGITQLTGITQDMVSGAPKFHEVAREIVELTESAIFVAHNARFDYGFIREEFRRLGFTYTRKQLCTVRLSRKAFPGLPSYSLGNLIRHFNLQVDARHRALADATATAEILGMILDREENAEQAKLMVNMGIRESKLPRGITLQKIEDLPESCGVYYFHDKYGQVVYVGKSINIKKRIAEHFADQTHKGRNIQKLVADISYEETGSELVALLLESEEIKRLMPSINRAQRRRRFPHAIHAYTNEQGYLCFDVVRNTADNRNKLDIISEYPSITRAKGRLEYMRKEYELCSRFTNLFKSRSVCFHYHLKQCRGACGALESVEEYNERAEVAREHLRTVFDVNFILVDEGRSSDEHAVILVEEGRYRGYGYVEPDQLNDLAQVRDAIRTCEGYPDTARIIQRFLNDNPRARTIEIPAGEAERW